MLSPWRQINAKIEKGLSRKAGAAFILIILRMKNDRDKTEAKAKNRAALLQIFLDLEYLFRSDPVAQIESTVLASVIAYRHCQIPIRMRQF
jgi:hypothetical protein